MTPVEWVGLTFGMLSLLGGMVVFISMRETQMKAEVHSRAKELFASLTDLARLEEKVNGIEADLQEIKALTRELLRRVPAPKD